MRIPKLTAFFAGLSVFVFVSCKSTEEVEKENIYVGKALPMTGAQETPPIQSSATGSIDATYNRFTKTLSYSITFSGLAKKTTAAHIHGPGETGVAAPVIQTFNGFPVATAGSYSNTLLIDGVKLTEENLLAGRYYINIHDTTYPAGEIRGQLILTKQ